jgi:hypothetical protein
MGTVIVPEIFSPIVMEKLNTSIRIGRVAQNFTSSVSQILSEGDTLHWPYISRNMKAVDVVKGTPLVPDTLDTVDITSQIKHVAVPFIVFDVENIQVNGVVMDNVVEGCVTALAQTIDADLATAMDTDAVFKSPTAAATSVTVAELYAGMSMFNDQIDTESFAGIIINSRLWPSFVNMPEFVKTDYTFQTMGNGKVKDGVIGYLLGIPIIVCDNNTFDETAGECKTYLVKRGSLGWIFQQNITVEEQRNIRLLATDIVVSSLYSTKLLDSKGCVILRKTA